MYSLNPKTLNFQQINLETDPHPFSFQDPLQSRPLDGVRGETLEIELPN